MKHTPIIPEQHWLNEPTVVELKKQLRERTQWLVAAWIVAIVMLVSFIIVCHLR